MKFHRAALLRRAALMGWVPVVMILSACGGGSSEKPAADATPQAQPSATADAVPAADAFRFLQQATMGAAPGDEARVKALGYEKWIDEQVTIGPIGGVDNDYPKYVWRQGPAGCDLCTIVGGNDLLVQEAFWLHTLEGRNQLRQRVAFALSQLFVISGANNKSVYELEKPMAEYQRMLRDNAFGNFRDLLEKVALHPAMGTYLSHRQNDKGDDRADGKGQLPDENFAREVMQLFTIGKWKLNLDGTRKLDARGEPIPTYTQAHIMGMARVFTGWSWGGPDTSEARWKAGDKGDGLENWVLPMQPYESHHSTLPKVIVDDIVIPANTKARESLKIALDTLFNHENTAPFIAIHMIKRLVTSNPSPAYVSRVAAVFKNNGKGVRGDMLAVTKAVLLDPEARDPSHNQASGGGKLREPVLRLSAALRALGARNPKQTYRMHPMQAWPRDIGQTPWMPPSVFNFYGPDYVPSSKDLADRKLTMPEAQIYDESTSIGYVNFIQYGLEAGFGAEPDRYPIQLDLAPLEALAADVKALTDELALRLMGGSLSSTSRTLIERAIASVGAGSSADWKSRRVRVALLMMLASPDFLIQK